jgi:hypothetical protein
MTTTYTVLSPASGTVYGRGLTAIEAAQEILGYDGHDYELRRDGDAFQLFVSRGSRNSYGGNRGLTEAYAGDRLVRSYAATEDAAWIEIAAKVIGAGWDNHPEAMTDAQYDETLAEIARDSE